MATLIFRPRRLRDITESFIPTIYTVKAYSDGNGYYFDFYYKDKKIISYTHNKKTIVSFTYYGGYQDIINKHGAMTKIIAQRYVEKYE